MAKKVVATLKTGKGITYTKIIKVERSNKTGAYTFREEIMPTDAAKEFLSKR